MASRSTRSYDWRPVFKASGEENPMDELMKSMANVSPEKMSLPALSVSLFSILKHHYSDDLARTMLESLMENTEMGVVYYILDINNPCRFFHSWEAKKEILRLKAITKSNIYGPSSEWGYIPCGPTLRSYIFHYHKTIPASKATANHFPTPKPIATSAILPPSPHYVDILDDVICAPRVKVLKLEEKNEELEEKNEELEEKNEELEEKLLSITQFLEKGNIDAAKEMATVQGSEATVQGSEATIQNPLSKPVKQKITISDTNEDGISNNIRQQMVDFARGNNIDINFNKSRGEGQPPITLVAKSRPDFTMRLSTVQYHDPVIDDAEETVLAVTTEHKTEEGDDVGQLLAGAEKAMGDAMRSHVAQGGGVVHQIIAYALLLDFDAALEENQKCRVFKVSMNFVSKISLVHEGSDTISITEGLNRVLHALL